MNRNLAIQFQEQAWNLQADGKLDEALKALQEALRLVEQSEGPDCADAANLWNDVAEIEMDRQDLRGALAAAEQAHAIETALGPAFCGETESRIFAKTLELLGAIRRAQGDYASAEEHLKKALSVLAVEFGEASEETANAQNNLGMLYKYWGRFDEGLQLYNSALRVLIGAQGEDSLASAAIYHNIGGILHSRGDFAAADEPARKAWEISRRALGDENTETMLHAAAYAAILDGLGRYDECERIYRRAQAVFENVFGPEHYELAANLHNLAAVLDVQGRHDEAEQHYRRALAIKEKFVGVESVDAALTRHNLGSLLSRTGHSQEAVRLLQNAVAIFETRLAPDHPYLALSRENLKKAFPQPLVPNSAGPPLDPENKYLFHAAIESSEVLNIYSGNVVTDANGDAVVMLPDWFEAVNRDFRYQLTVIGAFAQAIVAEKTNRIASL